MGHSWAGRPSPSDPTSPTWGDYYLSQRKLSTDPTRVWTGFLFLLGFPVFVFAMGQRAVCDVCFSVVNNIFWEDFVIFVNGEERLQFYGILCQRFF